MNPGWPVVLPREGQRSALDLENGKGDIKENIDAQVRKIVASSAKRLSMIKVSTRVGRALRTMTPPHKWATANPRVKAAGDGTNACRKDLGNGWAEQRGN
jgi:hypothetical protein